MDEDQVQKILEASITPELLVKVLANLAALADGTKKLVFTTNAADQQAITTTVEVK